MSLLIVEDEASGYWFGTPWLVIREEGEPAIASFKTDGEAFDFVDEYEREQLDQSASHISRHQ